MDPSDSLQIIISGGFFELFDSWADDRQPLERLEVHALSDLVTNTLDRACDAELARSVSPDWL